MSTGTSLATEDIAMLVRTTGGTATVAAATDLTRLAVEADRDADLDAALGPLGRRADADHAWLEVAELERAGVAALPPGTDVDRWRADFAAMVRTAATHGWLDPTGTEVRAHLAAPGS